MSGSRTRILIAVAAISLMVAALAGTATAAPAPRGTVTTIRGLSDYYTSPHWSPKHATISHGDRVKWVATSGHHHIVAYGGNWTLNHDLPQGTSVTHRFGAAGTYLFRCSLHSTLTNGHCQGMCGKIVVH